MDKGSACSFMCGLGVGTAVALLFAPYSGAKMQRLVSRKAHKARKQLNDLAGDARGSAIDLLEKGKREIARQRQGLEQAVEAGTRAYKESIG